MGTVSDPGSQSSSSSSGVMARVKSAPRYRELLDFWTKVNNDWIFNLAGLLAYNFIVALVPLLIVVLGSVGLFLGRQSPEAIEKLKESIIAFLPPGIGVSDLVDAVVLSLQNSAGILLVIGLVTAFFAGTRLFIAVENCFSIIFRLPSRDAIWQNVMAFGMLTLYVLLVIVLLLISLFPAENLGITSASTHTIIGSALVTIARWIASLLVITLVLAILYALVPNRPLPDHLWRSIWRGTLVAALLVFLFELIFPLIQAIFLQAGGYGAAAAFAIVILFFLYYVALIVLLGAEVNSWTAGQRATKYDLPGLLREADQKNPESAKLPR
ncbi:MAG TPA: YihY/virulence factor BrkB family protein [Ktedonobacterales bacterium]|jgi:membrane protein